MKAPLLRPTFTRPLAVSRDEAVERIRTRLLARPDLAGRWRGKGRWFELHVPESERRVWSPHLSVRLDADDAPDAPCTLFGRFAPEPGVWTFFMFLYFLTAFIVVFGATLGWVQWASDERPWGLWSVAAGVPVLLLCHIASFAGARLGQAQMRALKGVLDDVVDGLDA